MRSRAQRRYWRYIKGMRRLKEDRQQHTGTWRKECSCWDVDAGQGHGRAFAFFADTPKRCSRPQCCGNARHSGMSDRLTMQERRAFQDNGGGSNL